MRALPENLADLFDFDLATLRVGSREGKHCEFKLQPAAGDLLRYGKALAAFSNTDGGVIVFGVTDAPRCIVGIEGAFPDEANWANSLRTAFAPEIDFSVREYLNLVERGRFVESVDEGDPAYMVIGSVQLNQALAGPLDPEDQNLPNEAADKLRASVEDIFWAGVPFTGQHLAKLAKHVGLRGDGPADPRYCIVDEKVGRVYYTRAGIERLEEALRASPGVALASFASKSTIGQYEAAQV